MKAICNDVQLSLADAELVDDAVLSHLDECEECRAVRQALTTLDEELLSLSDYSPPERVIEELLSKVASKETAPYTISLELPRFVGAGRERLSELLNHPDSLATRLCAMIASALIMLCIVMPKILVAALKILGFAALSATAIGGGLAGIRGEAGKLSAYVIGMVTLAFLLAATGLSEPELFHYSLIAAVAVMLLSIMAASRAFATLAFMSAFCIVFVMRSLTSTFFNDTVVMDGGSVYHAEKSASRSVKYNDMRVSESVSALDLLGAVSGMFSGAKQESQSAGLERLNAGDGLAESASAIDILNRLEVERDQKTRDHLTNLEPSQNVAALTAPSDHFLAKVPARQNAAPAVEGKSKPSAPRPSTNGAKGAGMAGELTIREDADREREESEPVTSLGAEILQRFWKSRRQTENLSFLEPRGYWANTYVPGDPVMMDLARKLRSFEPGSIASELDLAAPAARTTQPFDAPGSAALSLYLHSDRTVSEGKTRMLVQVGLRATERSTGTRPAMNVALVLDLRGDLPEPERARLRALVVALEKAREAGDRFSLTVIGREGGIVIKPGELRHGTVNIALEQLLSSDSPSPGGLGLVDGLRSAIASAKNGDDPTSPLGSSMVIFATTQTLGSEAGTLAGLAHEAAVDGVAVSAVSAGGRARPEDLEAIALAGQGNRRIMQSEGDAPRVIERELASLARVVARAVRLRIRLAHDVKLIGVLGSKRLDEIQAEAVRQAEKSVDARVARSLGIAADRGEDEDGIQIVIPAFYSGDSHVVLLDVVASGPGPVAEVTARYKDLVFLENGAASASLELSRGEQDAEESGPLQLNVLKNLLALQLSGALDKAGQKLGASEWEESSALANYYVVLLEELRKQVPGFRDDQDLRRDVAMLREYLQMIDRLLLVSPADRERERLSSSMRLGARLKVLPPPSIED